MQEVANQITPLTSRVERMDRTLRSLYRNGGEGAPGYLETAREIDNGRFDMIFRMFQEFKDDLKPLKKFMNDHIASEDQKNKDDVSKEKALAAKVDESERRFKRWLAVATLFLTSVTVLMNLRGCATVKAFFNADSLSKPAVQLPQNSQAMPQQAKEDPGPIDNK